MFAVVAVHTKMSELSDEQKLAKAKEFGQTIEISEEETGHDTRSNG
jgi:hypothetical protein